MPCRRIRRLHAKLPLPTTGPYEFAGYQRKPTVVRLVHNPRFHVWSMPRSRPATPTGSSSNTASPVRAPCGRSGEQGRHHRRRPRPNLVPADLGDAPDPLLKPALLAPIPLVLGLWLNTTCPPFNDVRGSAGPRLRCRPQQARGDRHPGDDAAARSFQPVRRRLQALLPLHGRPRLHRYLPRA